MIRFWIWFWTCFCVCVTSTSAELHCDPVTEYESDGRCCTMCAPGTFMKTSSCEDPQCDECSENEYQETHAKATRCKRQPYCDPNRNFRISVHSSKTLRGVCVCEQGFHCSSQQCLTCVPHTVCEPGFGAQHKGNHSQDTTCKECSYGSFSNESSWDGVCHNWTTCEDGSHVKEKGSNVMDNKCGGSSSADIIIILVLVLVVSLLTAVATFILCRRKHQSIKKKPELCVECAAPERKHLHTEEQDQRITISSPEEEESDMSNAPEGITDNGNLVTQEEGKTALLSLEETLTAEETL